MHVSISAPFMNVNCISCEKGYIDAEKLLLKSNNLNLIIGDNSFRLSYRK